MGVHGGVSLAAVAIWLGMMTLLTIFFFGFASFCALLTGSLLILPAVYTVLLYAAVALEASARLVVQFLVFGLTGQRWLFAALSPVYHLRMNADRFVLTEWQTDELGRGSEVYLRFLGWPTLLGYAAAGLVFVLLAFLLLRKRKMESAGTVVAVPWLRRAFCWCAASSCPTGRRSPPADPRASAGPIRRGSVSARAGQRAFGPPAAARWSAVRPGAAP